jgi:hypothetical protein
MVVRLTLRLLSLCHGQLLEARASEYPEMRRTIVPRGGRSRTLSRPSSNRERSYHEVEEQVNVFLSRLLSRKDTRQLSRMSV